MVWTSPRSTPLTQMPCLQVANAAVGRRNVAVNAATAENCKRIGFLQFGLASNLQQLIQTGFEARGLCGNRSYGKPGITRRHVPQTATERRFRTQRVAASRSDDSRLQQAARRQT